MAHSGRILQGLTYRPPGAMVAAPTTSLPEDAGGERNWDYRYCWIRHAGFTLRALWVAACLDEAGIYLDYITAAAGRPRRPATFRSCTGFAVSTISPSGRSPGSVAGGTARWFVSAKGAWDQTQHDIYGELLLSVHHLREQFGELTDIERRLLTYLADAACEVWRQPDHGIWEIRDEPRHHVHSKKLEPRVNYR